ncbi:MAG: NAD(+) synthase [Muribaculaceae bacterium]|nr:NAD(+) synthase [Muribaculaceae bacterium]
MHEYGFIKIATSIPKVNVADCEFNTSSLISIISQAGSQNVEVLLCPELSVTAYTCGDLFAQSVLLDSAEHSVEIIRKESLKWADMLIIIGAPLRNEDRLYNCAIAIMNGKIVGVVPKSYLPNYNEFYEKRWFASGYDRKGNSIKINNESTVFSTDLIFVKGEARMAIEICEDLWTPIPPGSRASMGGANVILNLSASNEVIGKHSYLVDLICQQSAKTRTAYIYSSSGYGESSTDLVFAGNAIICENGALLDKSKRFQLDPQLIIADVDIERLVNERRKINMSHNGYNDDKYTIINLDSKDYKFTESKFFRSIDAHPFIPSRDNLLSERCEEVVNIQSMGLMRRLEFTHTQDIVIGISGGLDSTLALLISVLAFDRLGLCRKGIYGITMPGFGTTDRTYLNALTLMKELGITIKEIPIADSVLLHFKAIGHSVDNHDVTYENSQARERTQILMDYANKVNGMVVGTGDLSELALGWATYNGDHMSMYGVNASIPKTLVKYLVNWFASRNDYSDTLKKSLLDVIDTPISPELLPSDKTGEIEQCTEDLVGPYELHDFFLYYCIRCGYSPRKIYFLAQRAFADVYSDDTIRKWIKKFYQRFFTQQFKRSCLPDGPKVGTITLSPRGDWRMPSDASFSLWLKDCESM